MANTIKADDLAKEVMAVLEEYKGATHEMLEQATNEVARETARQLRATSPKGRRKGHPYAKSWTFRKDKTFKVEYYGKIIYAKAPEYRLTHLLEYGHALRGGGRSSTSAQAHIKPAEQAAIQAVEDKIIQKIKNGLI